MPKRFLGNFEDIGAGDTVGFRTIHNPENEYKGRAVIYNREHKSWVLNAGGRHGTPKIVGERNFTRIIRKAK